MLATLILLLGYLSFYLLFGFLGIGFSSITFSGRSYLATLLSPLFGIAFFCVFSTALMNFMPGMEAGRIGFLITVILSIACYALSNAAQKKQYFGKFFRSHRMGFLAGIIFLGPLLLTSEIGIFTLHGADFTSYVGWADYFQNYTLRTILPGQAINYYESNTAQIMHQIATPGGNWRIGSISLFAALDALLPVKSPYWPTLYTLFIAILVGQFVIVMQLFSRVVLWQSFKNIIWVGAGVLLLNTIFWLASAHFIPNLFGIVFSILLISMYTLVKRFTWQMCIAMAVISAALWLVCAESFSFFIIVLALQLILRDSRLLKRGYLRENWYKKSRIIAALSIFISSAILAILLMNYSFLPCLREFILLLTYNNPGDFVGIQKWAYVAQGLGFVDYNSIVIYESSLYFKWLLFANYAIAFSLLAYLLFSTVAPGRGLFQQRASMALFVFLIFISGAIAHYYSHEHYFLVWRALINISPYFWLLIIVAALKIFSNIEKPRIINNNVIQAIPKKDIRILACLFGFLGITAISFHVLMISYAIQGNDRAAIFGKDLPKKISFLQTYQQYYDMIFVDFRGSGIVRGGWELYFNRLPYLFPLYGFRENEYSVVPIIGKKIAVISNHNKEVCKLIGFNQTTHAYRGSDIILTENNNAILAYSSSWIYQPESPSLTLPGLPGKVLLWVKKDSKACLTMKASSDRDHAYLRVTINNQPSILKPVVAISNEKICSSFKKGLNVIRLEPVFIDKQYLGAQKDFVKKAKMNLSSPAEERNLLAIYSGAVGQVNPFISPPDPSGMQWSVSIPPNKFPFNPYIVFKRITVSAM